MNQRWVPREYAPEPLYKLRNPDIADEAFEAWPVRLDAANVVNGIDTEFDDIENAEQDALISVNKMSRRCSMLDEELEDSWF